jgi:hypothetical protein
MTQALMTLIAGTAAQAAAPMLGASGAIPAVLGAYFVLIRTRGLDACAGVSGADPRLGVPGRVVLVRGNGGIARPRWRLLVTARLAGRGMVEGGGGKPAVAGSGP